MEQDRVENPGPDKNKDVQPVPVFTKEQETQMKSWMASALADALEKSGPSSSALQAQGGAQPGNQVTTNDVGK